MKKTAKPIATKAKAGKPAKGPVSKPNFHTKAKALGLDLTAKTAKAVKVTMEIDPDFVPAEERGRPTILTPDLGSRVCTLYAAGFTFGEIEKHEGMPSTTTMNRWLASPNLGANGPLYQAFRVTLAHARSIRSHTRLQLIDGALQRVGSTKAQRDAGLDAMDPGAARVFIDGHRLMMELENRKDYGKHVTLASDPKNPVVPKSRFTLTEDELLHIAAQRQIENATDE